MSEQAYQEFKKAQEERRAREIAFYEKIAQEKDVSFQCAMDICFLMEFPWRTQAHENYIIVLDKAGLPPISDWSKPFEVKEIET